MLSGDYVKTSRLILAFLCGLGCLSLSASWHQHYRTGVGFSLRRLESPGDWFDTQVIVVDHVAELDFKPSHDECTQKYSDRKFLKIKTNLSRAYPYCKSCDSFSIAGVCGYSVRPEEFLISSACWAACLRAGMFKDMFLV